MLDIDSLTPLPPFSKGTIAVPAYQRYLRYYQFNFLEQEKCIAQAFGGLHLGEFHIAVHALTVKKPKGSVLIIHGYLDHSVIQSALVECLLAESFNVFLFDLPGHGLSSGERGSITSFDDYQAVLAPMVTFMQEESNLPRYLIGHSTGASIAMQYLLSNQYHGFYKAVFIAPLVEPVNWLYIKSLAVFAQLFLTQVKRQFTQNTSDLKKWYFMQYQDPLQVRFIKIAWLKGLSVWIKRYKKFGCANIPVLMVQGDKDYTVNWKKNKQLIEKKFKHLSYIEMSGARHHLVNEVDQYRASLLLAIKQFIG